MPEQRSAVLSVRRDLGVRRLFPAWRAAFSRSSLGVDANAGLTATGLSLALAIIIAHQARLPATAALVTVVIASSFVAILGGSTLGLSGPGLAMGLVVAQLASLHGTDGVALAVAVTGFLQLLAGALGVGRFARLVPLTVVHGFTFGMGVVLCFLCVPYVLGIDPPTDMSASSVIDQVSSLGSALQPASITIAALVCLATIVGSRFVKRTPIALIAVALAALSVKFGHLRVSVLPDLPVRIPRFVPLALPTQQIAAFSTATLALFALATLETFLSASAEEQRVPGERYDPDQELIGHGIANVLVALFGGIPAAGSIVRSRALHNGGAQTRAAGVFHGLAAALLVPLVLIGDRYIPLAALAGVIVAHAVKLLDPRPLVAVWRISKVHAAVVVVTATTMLLTNLLTGIETGAFLALMVAVARVARFRATLHSGRNGGAHQVTFSGPITFLAVPELERLRVRLASLDMSLGVILDQRDVPVMDLTGCTQFLALVADIADRGGNPALFGCAPACRDMLLAADRRGLVEPRLAVSDRDIDRILGRKRAFEMRAHVVASLERFRAETRGHYESLFEQLADGQHPHTLFITCVDSRISPSMLTGSHPGEVFVVRCLGAMVPPPSMAAAPNEGAAIEYAVGVLGVRNIVVCGHSQCGAVKAAKSGHVPDELASLQRWLTTAPLAVGDLSAHENLDDAARAITVRQLENIRAYALVRDRLATSELQLHAWFYDVAQAELFEWDAEKNAFEVLSGPRNSLVPGD